MIRLLRSGTAVAVLLATIALGSPASAEQAGSGGSGLAADLQKNWAALEDTMLRLNDIAPPASQR